MAKVGIIGGSGLYDLEGVQDLKPQTVQTPFGEPSGDYMVGKFKDTDVVFLPRHGKGHQVSPSEINYRANIFGMKKLGVDAIISVSACGSLKEEIKPLDFVVPDQFVDRTSRTREQSFFTDGIVAHVAMGDPVAPEVADILVESVRSAGATVHANGTYVNMEGPQFSTKAESNLYRSWGMDIIGMTNMVEAKLAREAEISYATLAAVTDYDCWHPDHDSVTVDMIIEYLTKNVSKSKEILQIAIPKVGALKNLSASNALSTAIVTNRDYITDDVKKRLNVIIGKYIS